MTRKGRQDKYFYPVTPETMHHYAASIFTPIRRGECVTAIWVPMSGRRMWNKFVIENIDLSKKELPDYQKYFLVYIEPLDLTEESLAGYLRLMGKSLIEACRKQKKCKQSLNLESDFKVFDDEAALYSKLLEALKLALKEITSLGFKITFFLGEFDELSFAKSIFYNNLKSIWSVFRPRLTYVFLAREDLATPAKTVKYGELNEALLENVVFVPMDRENIPYMIKRNEKMLGRSLSEKEKKVIEKVCGAHPFLVKAATRIVALQDGEKRKEKELENFLLQHYQLRSAVQKILNLRTKEEKNILMQISQGEKTNLASREGRGLSTLGLIFKGSDKKFHPFSLLFEKAILHTIKKPTVMPTKKADLSFDEKTGLIIYGNQSVEEKFTRQEYDLLSLFLKESNKLHSRDRIGEVLWGEESYEKYSNWAIDQIVSKIRKKLKELGVKPRLVTVRGRGYKLSPS